MKKIIVHHRSHHHAVNSGYASIIDFMSVVDVVTGSTMKFPYTLAKWLSQRTDQRAGNYNSSSFLKEIALYKLIRQYKKEENIVHYLNAERDIRFFVQYKQLFKNTSFCGTFHKPPDILKNQITDNRYLKKLDGLIAVGENQVDFLKEWLGIRNVQYIPHGVNTQFFKPFIRESDEQRILFVGQHLRDFETFNKSIAVILKQFPNLKVDIVIHRTYIKQIQRHTSITIYSGIDDVKLRELYQKATLLFLPLKNVTACNSILEAMACGLPIVTTDVGGNPTYLKGSSNILVPKQNSNAFIDVISKLLKDDDKLDSMGKSSRLKAMEYDWEIITKEILSFYNKTINEKDS